MRVPIDQLPDHAHTWVFGISPALDPARQETLLHRVDAFLDEWAAHGTPIHGARELREASFLVVAADPEREKSGCSIDRMFGTLRGLEHELGVQILDSSRVFFRDASGVRAVNRSEFGGVAGADTRVFDVTAETLGEIRSGAWERRAADSWHRQLLPATA